VTGQVAVLIDDFALLELPAMIWAEKLFDTPIFPPRP
jgi:hypothetical protein